MFGTRNGIGHTRSTQPTKTEQYDYIHEVQPLDGEIFLKSHTSRVAPRDKLATMWGAMKEGK